MIGAFEIVLIIFAGSSRCISNWQHLGLHKLPMTPDQIPFHL